MYEVPQLFRLPPNLTSWLVPVPLAGNPIRQKTTSTTVTAKHPVSISLSKVNFSTIYILYGSTRSHCENATSENNNNKNAGSTVKLLTTIRQYLPDPVRSATAIALTSCLAACGGGSTLISSPSTDVIPQSPGAASPNSAIQNDPAITTATETQIAVGSAIKDRAIKVLSMGDSITKGSKSCSYRTPLVKMLQNYPAEFVGKQGKDSTHPSECTQTNFEHEGRPGWRTIDWLESAESGNNRAYGAAKLQKADIVLLHIGSNDINRGELPGIYDRGTGSGTETVGRISAMIDDILAGSPTATVYVADLIPWPADPIANANLDLLRLEINTMAEHRAAKGDNVTLVKVYEGFQPNMMQADKVHPNAAGDAYLAGKWLEAMRSDGFFLDTGNTTKIRVEAESGLLTGNMRVGYDGSGYVATYYANEYQADFVTLDFTVEDTGVYRVLGRVKGTSTESDSLFFQIEPDGEIVNWSIPATGNYETDYVGNATSHYIYLRAGTQSARVYNRRIDTRLDWLEFQFLGEDPSGDADSDGVVNVRDFHPNDASKQ